MIPDLITPLSKQTKTRQSFVAFLNNLIEEGVAKIVTYSNIWNKETNANVFTYSYNISTVMEILNSYSEHGLNLKNAKATIPKGIVNVTLPREIADQLNPVAMKIGEQFRLYGFRARAQHCLD